MHILRANLLPRYVHIFLFLPLRLTLPFARQLDTELRTWVETALDLQLRTPQCHAILVAPPKWGGLGITTLEVDALLHCYCGYVALPAAQEPPSTVTEADSLTMAQEELQRILRKDPVAMVSHLLPSPCDRRYFRLWPLAIRMTDHCPWLQIPPITAEASRQGITAPFAYRGCHGLVDCTGSAHAPPRMPQIQGWYALPRGTVPRRQTLSVHTAHPWHALSGRVRASRTPRLQLWTGPTPVQT